MYIFRSRKIDKKLGEMYLTLKSDPFGEDNFMGWMVATINRKRKQAELSGDHCKKKKTEMA